jgi:hypothetical protein
MKRFFLFSSVAVFLAACQTPANTPPISPVVNVVVGALPAEVQAIAVKTCGYLPLAETVAALVAAFGGPSVPGVASQIAAEICGAVTKKSAIRKGRGYFVRGVPVQGHFVR